MPEDSRAPEPITAHSFVATHSFEDYDVVADMLRGLLRTRTSAEVVVLLHRTIQALGGTLAPPSIADGDLIDLDDHALPIDVSLGEGPPLVATAEPVSLARMQLERLLPRLVEDARQAVDLLRQAERLEREASRTTIPTSPVGFDFRLDWNPSTFVLTLAGELDTATTDVLHQWVGDAAGTAPAVKIDLTELAFIGAAGINALWSATRSLQWMGTTVVITGASDWHRRLFRICGLEHLLDP